MSPLVQTLIGVAVSVILFLAGYRQTVGAKKERIRSANLALRRTLLRRVVLEDYQPQARDLSRLIEGKAREANVTPDDLLSEEQLLTGLFAEVFESELINQEKRTAQVRGATVMDYLYRLRIRTNYEDATMFTDGPETVGEADEVRRNLSLLGAGTLLIHELAISDILGPAIVVARANQFVASVAPSGGASSLLRRIPLIRAHRQ